MKTILLSLALIAAAIVLLGVNALFRPRKGFPTGHSHDLAHVPERQRQLREAMRRDKKK